MPVLIVVGILFLIVIWLVSLFNGLVRLRNRRQNAFADIDVQLRQRHDLVPQLVESVKGYAGHEKEVFTKITEARSAAMNATTIDGKIVAEQQLTSALAGLKVQVEAYPDLKANQNFMALQAELTSTEDRVAFARQSYNDSVTKLNTAIQTFPTVVIAGMFGFKEEPFFETPAEEKKAPTVQF